MHPPSGQPPEEQPPACAYPAPPPPVPVRLVTLPEHPCPYLPDRIATTRAFHIEHLPGPIYHQFMDASFRRSGNVIYQPICHGCRQCLPLRVPVDRFMPSKSQRRNLKRNADVILEIDLPKPTDEKYALYLRYQSARHGENESSELTGNTRETYEQFLYQSPVETLEFTYRDTSSRLLAIGICDICPASLSSVYFYYDPDQSRRGLGICGILREIDYASRHNIPYYYLGYWIKDSPKMDYKSSFNPHQILQPHGLWVDSIIDCAD